MIITGTEILKYGTIINLIVDRGIENEDVKASLIAFQESVKKHLEELSNEDLYLLYNHFSKAKPLADIAKRYNISVRTTQRKTKKLLDRLNEFSIEVDDEEKIFDVTK